LLAPVTFVVAVFVLGCESIRRIHW